MSTPTRSAKDRDPALTYAPPRVCDQTQQTPIEPSLPRAEWPLEIQRFGSSLTFGGDHAAREMLPARVLQSEGIPEPPEPLANSRAVRKIALWACGAAGLAALGVWTMVLGPGATLFGHQDSRESLPAVPASANLSEHDLLSYATATRQAKQPDVQRSLGQEVSREPGNDTHLAPASERAIATSAVPAPSKAAPQPAPTVQSPAPALVTRHLDRDEVVSLINRGEDLIKSGDLASAQLALRRAAEAGDARAALLLAGTFDPNLLEKIRFQASKADAGMARFWYERAAQLGSAEASGRLQQLANTKTNAGP
jgi:hypothetical protein